MGFKKVLVCIIMVSLTIIFAYLWLSGFIILAFFIWIAGVILLQLIIHEKKPYTKYPRTFVNGIITESDPWRKKFGGTKKNNDGDCVIAMVSSVPVQGGYGYVNQPVAPGDKYTPNSGEDLDGFIRRDGTVRKFNGKFGSWPFIGETELSADVAHRKFNKHWGDGMEWFRNNPPCQ